MVDTLHARSRPGKLRIVSILALVLVLVPALLSQGADDPADTKSLKIEVISPPGGELMGQQLRVEVIVANSGKAAVENIVLKVLLDANLQHSSGQAEPRLFVGKLKPGEKRVMPLLLAGTAVGKFGVRVGIDPMPALLNQAETLVQINQLPPPPQPSAPITLPNPPPTVQPAAPAPGPSSVSIDPKTPIEKLLPTPPPASPAKLVNGVTEVTEVAFESKLTKSADDSLVHIRNEIAAIRHVSKDKTDGFMTALLERRPDLDGLPFVLGQACRQPKEHSRRFVEALNLLRTNMSQSVAVPISDVDQNPGLPAGHFWKRYQAQVQHDGNRPRGEPKQDVIKARIATLMQVCGPQSVHMRKGLVKFLDATSHAESTQALAKLAIFSDEEDIRQAAVDALRTRRDQDYTDILVQGLRYPLPAVAKRTTEIIATLERNDLAPQLVSLLDEPDPRAPQIKEVKGKKVPVVRELVKMNHHRNCLMCHAPVDQPATPQAPQLQIRQVTGATTPPPPVDGVPPPFLQASDPIATVPVTADMVTGAIPLPGAPLPSLSNGYQGSNPDIFVRVDVTYLRQDFSLLQPVAKAEPWPEMQRFDFLVRTRSLTSDEATSFRDVLAKAGPSPYRQAAHAALRQLTKSDAEPTAEAWRELLKQRTP